MPNVLFLDDDPLRTSKFRSVHPYATTVADAHECIEQLAKQDWEIVCLDHDLGGEIFVAPEFDNTGSAVVRWIVANKPKVTRFFVHSFNTPAALEMVRALQAAGYWCRYTPFGIAMINGVYTAVATTE